MTSGPEGSSPGGALPVDRLHSGALRIGVVSDTHGYLDPYILELFEGVDLIIHAGDVGDKAILESLGLVARTVAVAGNLDGGDLRDLPSEAIGEIGGVRFVVGHKRKRLVKRLEAGKVPFAEGDETSDLVIFGHEHVPAAFWVERALWLNPGSASAPYEEDDVPTVAIVEGGPTGLCVRFIPLTRRDSRRPSPSAKPGRERPRKP